MGDWWNGRRGGFKLRWETVRVQVPHPLPMIKMKRGKIMKASILSTEIRISKLKGKDPAGNAKIIRKLERQLRKMTGEKEG